MNTIIRSIKSCTARKAIAGKVSRRVRDRQKTDSGTVEMKDYDWEGDHISADNISSGTMPAGDLQDIHHQKGGERNSGKVLKTGIFERSWDNLVFIAAGI